MATPVWDKEHPSETQAAKKNSWSFAAIVVAASILLYILLVFYHTSPYQHNLSSLIRVGSSNVFYEPSALEKGMVVFTDPKSGGDGYDGQFYYYMIKDLFMGHNGIPNPFRYQRILYPALVYVFALGQAKLIPLSMLLVNLFAIAVSALLLWRLIGFVCPPGNSLRKSPLPRFTKEKNIAGLNAISATLWERFFGPAYLLIYTLNVGFLIAVFYDVATPLCVALIVAAAYFYTCGRLWAASGMMALSLLAQENGVVVLVAMGSWQLFYGWRTDAGSKWTGEANASRENSETADVDPAPVGTHHHEAAKNFLRGPWLQTVLANVPGAIILGLPIVPWVAWQIFLWVRYGSLPFIMSGNHFRPPFAGMISQIASLNLTGSWSEDLRQLSVYPVMLFVLALLSVSAIEMKKKPTFFVLVLLLHGFIGVSFNREQIWSSTITSSARALAGVFPFLIMCYVQNRSRTLMFLIILSILLTLMGISRILLMPSHPFIVI